MSPEALTAIQTFWPIAAAFVGGTASLIFSVMTFIARGAWKTHQSRMKAMADALSTFAKNVKAAEEAVEKEHRKIWESLQGMRAELQFSQKSSEDLRSGLLRLEGALENHRTTVYQHVERLGRIDSKLEAIFRFMDAPRRSSDAASGGS